MNKPDELGELAARVAAGSKDVRDHMSLVSALEESGRLDEIIPVLRIAVTLPLTNVELARSMSALAWHVWTINDDRAEACTLAERAIELTTGNDTTLALLTNARAMSVISACIWHSDCNRATRMAASAVMTLERLLSTDRLDPEDRHPCLLEAAGLYESLEMLPEGARCAKEALRIAETTSQQFYAMTVLASIHQSNKQFDQAREIFSNAIRMSGTPVRGRIRAYHQLALVEVHLGKLAEARAKVCQALSLLRETPRTPCSYFADLSRLQASISYEMGDIENAAKSYRAAVESLPNTDTLYWNSLLWLGQCQYKQGEVETARRTVESVRQSSLASNEDRAGARDWLATVRTFIRT